MKSFLSIIAMFGLAACTSTTTGGAGGGTPGTTTTTTTPTVSVACADCLSTGVTWGYTGGLAQYWDTSSLSACRTFQHTRTQVVPWGVDAGPGMTCSVDIGGCDAGTVAVHDVEQALAQPDVVAAFAGSVPVYGTDPRPCDGGVMQVTVGGKSIQVGGECGGTGNCIGPGTSGCVPIPPGVRALVDVLTSIDQASMKQGDCATVFP
jgi:hypothetical protein